PPGRPETAVRSRAPAAAPHRKPPPLRQPPPSPPAHAARGPLTPSVARRELVPLYTQYARACSKKDTRTLSRLTTPDYTTRVEDKEIKRPEALVELERAHEVPAGSS